MTEGVPVRLRRPFPQQEPLVFSTKKRQIARCGRRSGKTTGVATKAAKRFLEGGRVLYGAPTQEQVGRFWFEVKRALQQPLDRRLLYKNESEHIIEVPRTENRIRAKTAWSPDTLRGDYADLLILDEWQLMQEETWGLVGAPMMLDHDGDAVFLYTPPSLSSLHQSRSRDKLHASKMFKRAQEDPLWDAITFASHANPTLSKRALESITRDMTQTAYRMEILAEDIEEAPGALWKRAMFGPDRMRPKPETLVRVVVACDPSGSRSGDAVGIAAAGIDRDGIVYVLEDATVSGKSPNDWAREVVYTHYRHESDRILGERNFGGDMVENTIRTIDPNVPYRDVHASRGKAVRAEPVAAMYEQDRVFHCAGHAGPGG